LANTDLIALQHSLAKYVGAPWVVSCFISQFLGAQKQGKIQEKSTTIANLTYPQEIAFVSAIVALAARNMALKRLCRPATPMMNERLGI